MCPHHCFQVGFTFPQVLAHPRAMAAGDLDGDGYADVAVVDAEDDTSCSLHVVFGGWIPQHVHLPAAIPFCKNLAVGDVDGDGDLEIAVAIATPLSGNVALFQHHQRTFSLETMVGTNNPAMAVAIEDVCGTSNMKDLVVAESMNDEDDTFLQVLRREESSYTALAPTQFGSVFEPVQGMAFADFSGDGIKDVVVDGSSDLFVLKGNGAGAFEPFDLYSATLGISHPTVGDFNEDHKPDIVVHNTVASIHECNEGIELFLSQPGGLIQRQCYRVEENTTAMGVADFDKDGHLDVVAGAVGLYDSTPVARLVMFRGDGTGILTLTEDMGNVKPASLSVGDFNKDGIQDLALSNKLDKSIELWMGSCD